MTDKNENKPTPTSPPSASGQEEKPNFSSSPIWIVLATFGFLALIIAFEMLRSKG